jgi:PhnB protein
MSTLPCHRQGMTTSAVSPKPDNYPTVVPYISVRGAAALLDFLIEVFGAVERGRFPNPDGTLGHAEVDLGGSVLMAFDAQPDWPATPSLLTVWVDDCDATHAAALAAGAVEVTPLTTSAFGFRGCRVRDPFGNIWWIQTQVEVVDGEEAGARLAEPRYAEAMRVAVETLDAEMRRRD